MENRTVVTCVALSIFCVVLALVLSAWTHFVTAGIEAISAGFSDLTAAVEATSEADLAGLENTDAQGIIDRKEKARGEAEQAYRDAKSELEGATERLEKIMQEAE